MTCEGQGVLQDWLCWLRKAGSLRSHRVKHFNYKTARNVDVKILVCFSTIWNLRIVRICIFKQIKMYIK